ncbi:MAG: rRNA maturation RNase YbeY [Vicingaceae bacterium]|jgi:rRNA maturation RNase YbeY
MSPGSVIFHVEDVDTPSLTEASIATWVNNSVDSENKQLGIVNCILCSDQYLLEINKTYLNHDTFTDIVTFNYVENDIISGDLFISLDRVKDNAVTFSVDYLHELRRVIIHGVLHLIGYNDKTLREAEEIRAKEDFYLTLYAD